MEVISDLNFLDPELSEDGIEQANKQAEVAKLTEFTTVLVSPLRRALETAYLLFKDTNYFNSLKFVIVPILREQIYSVAEIPQNFQITFDEYQQKLPNLDASIVFENYPDLENWFLQDLEPELQ